MRNILVDWFKSSETDKVSKLACADVSKGGTMEDHEKNSSFRQKQQGSSSSDITPEQLQRMELLKLQKELQRRERERAAWREASMPRNVFSDSPNQIPRDVDEAGKPMNSESEFFNKLRRGKFLE